MSKSKLPIPGDLLKNLAAAKLPEGAEVLKTASKHPSPDLRGVAPKAKTKPAGRAVGAGQTRSSNRGK